LESGGRQPHCAPLCATAITLPASASASMPPRPGRRRRGRRATRIGTAKVENRSRLQPRRGGSQSRRLRSRFVGPKGAEVPPPAGLIRPRRNRPLGGESTSRGGSPRAGGKSPKPLTTAIFRVDKRASRAHPQYVVGFRLGGAIKSLKTVCAQRAHGVGSKFRIGEVSGLRFGDRTCVDDRGRARGPSRVSFGGP
jgi:hypothetical protein